MQSTARDARLHQRHALFAVVKFGSLGHFGASREIHRQTDMKRIINLPIITAAFILHSCMMVAALAAGSPVAIHVRADHYGHDRFHEYMVTNGTITVREIRASNQGEISSYEVRLTGELKDQFEKAMAVLFAQMISSTNMNRFVRDGTRYTVLMKSGGQERKVVNYETHDEALTAIFRELNKVIPGIWQLHNP